MRNPEDILDKITKKQESKIADLSPEERADLERRQRKRSKRILEEAKRRDPQLLELNAVFDAAFVVEELATKEPIAFNSSLEKILSEFPPEVIEAFLDKWREATYLYLDGINDDLDDIAHDRARAEGRRQGMESAVNLQGILGEIANIKAQGDRIETKADEVKKDVSETRQGVGALVQHLPDAKKPPHIEEAEAVAIMKAKGVAITDRTLRNWLKDGVAGRVKLPISWDNLATVASWSAWADAYLAAEKTRLTRKSFISERQAQAEAIENRRRGRIA